MPASNRIQACIRISQPTLAIFAALICIAWFGFWAKSKPLTGTIWAILLSNLSILPQSSTTYDVMLIYLVPMDTAAAVFDSRCSASNWPRGCLSHALARRNTVEDVVIGVSLLDLFEYE